MTTAYITPLGAYYEGDQAHALDVPVPPRPTQFSTWDGLQWNTPTPAAQLDLRAGVAVDGTDRLWFEVNFDQENRIRALEGKAAITRAQYRNALITAWKSFN